MADHVHKWRVQHDVDHAYIWCEDYWKNDAGECEMSIEEAERRLNATERLSAGQAGDIARWVNRGEKNPAIIFVDALDAYASELEGKET